MVIKAAGHPVVEQGDPAVGHDKKISSMEVTMENSVDHRAFEKGNHHGVKNRLCIDPGFLHATNIVIAETFKALHDEHP